MTAEPSGVVADHRSPTARIRRRVISVPVLFVGAIVGVATSPVWLPVALVADALRGRLRFPLARLGSFGLCWASIECLGVMRAFGQWSTGRARDPASNYRLMAWWSSALMRALALTTGIRPRIEGLEQLASGNAIMLARHASLADSLLSAWVTSAQARVWPRYVLKRELLSDPCLDIVGLRIPNHFLDREAVDGDAELDALRSLAVGVGPGVVAVIFAEGTRANDRKRARALEKIGARDPARAERLAGLRHLLPPRPAGSLALVEGAPAADVLFAWHTGFDGLDSFGRIIEVLCESMPPVRFVIRRVSRREVPTGEAFVDWLDEQWIRMDAEVDEALQHIA